MFILDKKPDETNFEYHKRLVYGKLVDKTLSDFDYTELSKYVYGRDYSCDVARRLMYGSCKTLELLDSETDESLAGDRLNQINSKLEELQRERQRFYDQRREYNKLVYADGRKEHLYESLTEAALNLDKSIGKLYGTDEHDYNAPIDSDNSAVLVLSDWHYGLKASNIFNEYDTDICKERVRTVVNETIKRIQLHNCDELRVVVLGDLIHGAIHTSARVASEELVCDQLMQVSEILAQSVLKLSTYVNKTHVYITYGNHARTIQNKSDSIHRDNMERLIPWWLCERLKQHNNITVYENSNDEFISLSVKGHDIIATHGDLDSVKTSPRLLPTLFQKQRGLDVEYVLLGDKHHIESFNELGITSMLCGSLCGTDDYASDRRLYSHPSQLLLIVNEEYGVDAEYRIKCC